MRTFDNAGVFWLPESQGSTLTGWLKFDGASWPKLTLVGSFAPVTSWGGLTASIDAVNGVLDDGTLVTLLWSMTTQVRLTRINTTELTANLVLSGAQLAHVADLAIRRFEVSFDHLPEWACLGGMAIELPSADDEEHHHLAIRYAHPDTPPVCFDGWKISFAPSAFMDPGTLQRGATLRQTLALRVERDEPFPLLPSLNEMVPHLQNLIALGTDGPVYVETHTVRFVGSTEDVELSYPVNRTLARSVPVTRPRMLFCLPQIRQRWAACLENWFGKRELLEPVFQLYFASIYTPAMSAGTRFLNLVHALETYHRRRYGGVLLSKEQWQVVQSSLQAALESAGAGVGGSEMDLLRGKLRYLNEPSLRRRLRELCTASPVSSFLIPDPRLFAAAVTDTRNYLTHYDAAGKDAAASCRALRDLDEQMGFLLATCFLRELGLSDDLSETLVRNAERFVQLHGRMKRA